MQRLYANCKFYILALLRQAWVVYGLLSVALLVPLLKPGYILTLDMVFTPSLRMPAFGSNDYLFRVLLHVLNVVFPSDIIEKFILLAILLLSGVGLYRLSRYVNRIDTPLYVFSAYIAGIVYMANPFTYDRFMAGQYEVLLGYALLPWFTCLLLQFLDAPNAKRACWLSVSAVVIGIVSIHDIGLMVILALAVFIGKLWQQRTNKAWRTKVLKLGGLTIGIWIVASSYWLVPLMLGKGGAAAQISTISSSDQVAFATVGGSPLGRLANVVRLQGFWAEAYDLYTLPQTHIRAWGLINLVVWLLVVMGAVSLWRIHERVVAAACVLSAVIATAIAVGALSGWPTAHLPFLVGYREPQKFVALIALVYAVFIGCGIAISISYCRLHGGRGLAVILALAVLLLPLAWTPTIVNGFAGQLKPVHYPADWYAVNTWLKSDSGNFQTLFLPWHLYMSFNFERRIIANPAKLFFDKPVIVSDNPEFHGAALAGTTTAKRRLDQLLPRAEQADNFGVALAKLRIKYIIVDHDDSDQDYLNLMHRSDMQIVMRGGTLDVYRNERYRR